MRLLFASLAIALLLEPQKGPQRSEPQKDTARDTRGSAQTPVVVRVLPTQRSQAEASSDSTDKADHQSNEWWTTKATIALAAITLLLTIGTMFLARYTLKLWEETRAAAGEAKTSADRTLGHLETTAKQELRGYVNVSPGDISRLALNIQIRFTPILQNYGQTPAHKMVWRGGVAVFPFPAEPESLPLDDEDWRSIGVLGPGQRYALPLSHIFRTTGPLMIDPKERTEAVYVFGNVIYTDVFGLRHTTDFCYWINPGRATTDHPHHWIPTAKYNNAT